MPRVLAAFATILLAEAQVKLCPKPGEEFKASESRPGKQASFSFVNKAGVDVSLWWVDFEGKELYRGVTGDTDNPGRMGTFPGHVFNIRSVIDGSMLASVRASSEEQEKLVLRDCGLVPEEKRFDKSRWPEFEKLAADAQAPCEGPHTSKWSCVRWASPEEIAKRDTLKYGFHADDAPYGRKAGQTIDWGYGRSSQHMMLNVTEYDGGYLKMKMTDGMKKALYPWYEEKKKDGTMQTHGVIAGGYTNCHKIHMDKIDLDKFPEVHISIIREMSQVLQWWTKTRLRHTSTFGLRIYRRGSMLINHIDRQDTHIASAVLQVGQSIDDDGGWPLEVVHPHFPGRKEVYLQAGEMVLYEGARLHHGRPMRLKGNEFGNIFTHFAPLDWHGPRKAKENPYFDKDLRAKHHDQDHDEM